MFDFIDGFLATLSKVPGLYFLQSYRDQILQKRQQLDQDVGDKMAQKDATIAAFKKIKNLPKDMKGSKKKR
jgi:uncharacterized protein YoxC